MANNETTNMIYAGFWRRFGAHIIDSVIVTVITLIVAILFGILTAILFAPASAQETTQYPVTSPAPAAEASPTPSDVRETNTVRPPHPLDEDYDKKTAAATGEEDDEELDEDIVAVIANLIFQVIVLFFGIFYHTVFVASKWQATPGKRLVGVIVVNRDGTRLHWLTALARHLCCFFSAVTLCIGYMLIGWTREKTALHDMMCGTRVIRGEK